MTLKAEVDLNKEYPFIESYVVNIIESVRDAIITIDDNQRIILFNAAAEAIFGCSREQAVGKLLTEFIPDRFRGLHGEYIHVFGQTNTSGRRMGAHRVVRAQRCNGEEFPIEVSISHVSRRGKQFYTAILCDVSEQVQNQEALRQSKRELQELALTAHRIREQEKTRIAHELHDELGQLLTSLKMDIQWLMEKVVEDEKAEVQKLFMMQKTLDATIAVTRRISTDLRPLILDDLGLVAALEWLTQNFVDYSGVRCKLYLDGKPEEFIFPDLHATTIFRIVQESLTNISKHAEASDVSVILKKSDGIVVVKVQDNGKGFLPDAPRNTDSFGLLGLKERAYSLDGDIFIASTPGKGSTIEVRLPLMN